jgi:hypothetical protein
MLLRAQHENAGRGPLKILDDFPSISSFAGFFTAWTRGWFLLDMAMG